MICFQSKFIGIIIVILTACWYFGCSATPYLNLKEQPSGVSDFSIQENYEIVFQRMITQAKKCFEPRGYQVKSQIHKDKQTAEITVSILYRGTAKTLLTATISAISPQNTQVSTYYAYSPPGKWRDGAYVLQRWASSTEPYCP